MISILILYFEIVCINKCLSEIYLYIKNFQERIEAQERKITNLELSRKLASGGGTAKKSEADTIIKKITDAEEKEKECQKV